MTSYRRTRILVLFCFLAACSRHSETEATASWKNIEQNLSESKCSAAVVDALRLLGTAQGAGRQQESQQIIKALRQSPCLEELKLYGLSPEKLRGRAKTGLIAFLLLDAQSNDDIKRLLAMTPSLDDDLDREVHLRVLGTAAYELKQTSLFDQCEQKANRWFPANDPRGSICAFNRASFEKDSGLYRQAVERSKSVIAALKEHPEQYPARLVRTQCLLHQIYIEQEMDVETGVAYIKEPTNGCLERLTLTLASGLIKLLRLDEARELLKRVNPSLSAGLLAWLEQEAGNNAASVAHFNRISQPQRNEPNTLIKYIALLDSMRDDRALEYEVKRLESELGKRRDEHWNHLLWRLHFVRGMAAMAAKNKKTALSEFAAAEALQEEWLQVILTIGTEGERRSHLTNPYTKRFADILYSIPDVFPDDAAADLAAYKYVLARKGRAWDSLLLDTKELRRRGGKETEQIFANMEKLAMAIEDPRLSAEERTTRVEEYSRLTAALGQKKRTFRDVTVESVKTALTTSKAVLLDYVKYRPYSPKTLGLNKRFGSEEYAVFVVDPERPLKRFRLKASGATIDDLIAKFRISLTANGSDQETLARKLNAALLPPALRQWLDGRRTWIVVGDGPLHLVPYSALLGSDDHYLIESVGIRSANSSREVAEWETVQPLPHHAPVVIYDPALPDAEREGKIVAEKLGATLRVASLRELSSLDGPRVFHFVGHARGTEQQNPVAAMSDSRLLLPRGEFVSARQLGLKNLSGTLLAALSACETGSGTTITGDGVYGLRRGIALAEARSTLLTLWRVNDQKTADLMSRFYELALKEESGIALNRVQAELAPKARPHFWAGVVYSGPQVHLGIER